MNDHATALASPTRDSVVAAEAVIRPHIRRTPVLRTPAEDFGLSGEPITFKLEFLQHSGTFKARGAFANMLMRAGTDRGVVAASGGNHGAAVAYAAMRLGHKARIYVPSISSPAKIARIKSYGAEIVVGGEHYAEALAASVQWAEAHGSLQIHAYDQFETLAGQGTTALEWRAQAPELDTVLVAVGGGGLIGGMAAFYAGDLRIVGVEPEAAPTLYHALVAGEPVDVPVGGVAVDSLGARRVGRLMFPLAKSYVERSVLVSDAAIVDAQKVLWDALRVVAEPGGAAAFAALLSGRYVPAPGEKVGVLLCGANTTAVEFG
ncbi:MAG: threonine/serine dehydratase [Devosia sp.]